MANTEIVEIAVISLTATADRKMNVEQALNAIQQAVGAGAKWIFLPEMWAFHGPYDLLLKNAEPEDGVLNKTLSALAEKLRCVIFAGSVPEISKDDAKKVYNTQYVFDTQGKQVAKYRKVHLFNLKTADGTPLYCESDGYLAGTELVRFKMDGWSIGLATCYDLRFPEMFARLTRNEPVDLLAVPSAFTLQTGMYHWELLCRARAVDQLCFVAAANQVGQHSAGKNSFGHACVVNPWGSVIANTGPMPGVARARIDKKSIMHWRAQLPALQNKRPEIYV